MAGRRKRLLVLAVLLVVLLISLAAYVTITAPVPPPADVRPPQIFWKKDPSLPGSEFRNSGPVTGIAPRLLSDSFDLRADRVYVATRDRLYALTTYSPQTGDPDPPGLQAGDNAWGLGQFFNVSDDGPQTISVPPVAMNYGDYVQSVPDHEVYLGTDDGTIFALRDQGPSVPTGTRVSRVTLDGAVTGVGAFNPDMDGRRAIDGDPNHAYGASNGSWLSEPIGWPLSDEGEFASLGIDSAGEVHIGFYDVSNGQPRVVVRSQDAWTLRAWEPFSFSDNVGLYTSLAIGSDDVPRIAYYDETNGALRYAQWNGSTFVAEDVDTIGDVGRYASLALNSTTNDPRIAYYNATSRELKYAERIGGSWRWEVVPNLPGVDAGQYASLAVDGLGRPHIAYYDATNRALRYATRVGAVWTNETVDAAGDVGQYCSLAVDPATGDVHVAYYNATGGSLRYARKMVAWLPPTIVDDGGDVGRYASIAINSLGDPAIAYHDVTNLDLKYASWNSTLSSWENVTVQSAGHAGLYPSLRFNASGQPHIAHYSFRTGRTTADLVVAGTAAGKLYAIDVGIPGTIQRLPREKRVTTWDYRIRWVADVGSEAHVAGGPLSSVLRVPLHSPCFQSDGKRVFVGTGTGEIVALDTGTGGIAWREDVAAPGWRGAPVAHRSTMLPGVEEVLAGDDDGLVSVFRAADGLLVSSPRVSDAAVVAVTASSDIAYAAARMEVVSLRLAGQAGAYTVRWRGRLFGSPLTPAIDVPEKGVVYAADDTGRLYSYRLDNGRIEYRVTLCDAVSAGPISFVPPRSIQSHVWIGCRDGTILAASGVGGAGPVP